MWRSNNKDNINIISCVAYQVDNEKVVEIGIGEWRWRIIEEANLIVEEGVADFLLETSGNRNTRRSGAEEEGSW